MTVHDDPEPDEEPSPVPPPRVRSAGRPSSAPPPQGRALPPAYPTRRAAPAPALRAYRFFEAPTWEPPDPGRVSPRMWNVLARLLLMGPGVRLDPMPLTPDEWLGLSSLLRARGGGVLGVAGYDEAIEDLVDARILRPADREGVDRLRGAGKEEWDPAEPSRDSLRLFRLTVPGREWVLGMLAAGHGDGLPRLGLMPEIDVSPSAIQLLGEFARTMPRYARDQVMQVDPSDPRHADALELVDHGIFASIPADEEDSGQASFRLTSAGWYWYHRDFPRRPGRFLFCTRPRGLDLRAGDLSDAALGIVEWMGDSARSHADPRKPFLVEDEAWHAPVSELVTAGLLAHVDGDLGASPSHHQRRVRFTEVGWDWIGRHLGYHLPGSEPSTPPDSGS